MIFIPDQVLKGSETSSGAQRAPGARDPTRKYLLRRWADILDRNPRRELLLLTSSKFMKRGEWLDLGIKGTAIEAALDDPVLRSHGFKGSRVRDAVEHFDLSDSDACRIFCGSRNAARRTAAETARRIRSVADKRLERIVFLLLLLVALLFGFAVAPLIGSLRGPL